jgi:hypothetical protein
VFTIVDGGANLSTSGEKVDASRNFGDKLSQTASAEAYRVCSNSKFLLILNHNLDTHVHSEKYSSGGVCLQGLSLSLQDGDEYV